MLSTANSADLRVQKVYESNQIYYWSIRHQKIIFVNSNDNVLNDEPCELCIRFYRPKMISKDCTARFNCFTKLKKHIFNAESNFARPLVWSTESEIPTDLKRVREVGDLSNLEKESILKIQFSSMTLILPTKDMLAYYRINGCPCRGEEIEGKCKVKFNNHWRDMFSHLSHIERKCKKFIVFKGDSNEISEDILTKLKNSSLSSAKTNLPNHSKIYKQVFNSKEMGIKGHFKSLSNKSSTGFLDQNNNDLEDTNLDYSNLEKSIYNQSTKQETAIQGNRDQIKSNTRTISVNKLKEGNLFIIDEIQIIEMEVPEEIKKRFEEEYKSFKKLKKENCIVIN